MRSVIAVILLASLVVTTPASAQHGGGAANLTVTAPREVSQFDFMVGEWDLDVRVPATTFATKIHGMPKLVGTWRVRKALDGWGLEDDMKITDVAGNPKSLSHAVRYFDRNTGKWAISGLDVYRGKFSTSTAEWRGNDMYLSGSGKDAGGNTQMIRTRIYDISQSGFKFRQEKSADHGKTWKETISIEARRASRNPA
ncbi:MAG: hypothetical protein ABI556_16635 [Gemmatimonadales bacterium]